MEVDPFGGARRHRDDGANLPEPVHLHEEHHHQAHDLGAQHRPYINPPTYAPHDKQDVSPSTKDGSKPPQAIDLDDADPGGRRISRKWTRKRFIVPIAMLVTIVAIGAVLGGVLGTMLSPKQGSADKSPYFSPESGDALVGPDSQLAASFSKSVHVVIAQTDNGELMAVEFHGSKKESYLIKDHAYDTKLPKALGNTPIELIQFGPEQYLHLFYFDDAFRLAHLVRVSMDGRDVWGLGALMNGRLPYEPADTARLSACIMSSDWSESRDSFLMVLYQADNGSDGMVLLSSSEPDSSEGWNMQPFYLEAEKHDAPLSKDSSGLLILPTTREDNGQIVPALRILWDPSDDDKKTTLGSIECTFSDESKMINCDRKKNDWKSVSVENSILDASKPLSLSGTTLSSDVNGTSTWIVNIVDSNGRLTALRGTDEEWTDSAQLKIDPSTLPDGKTPTFTSVGSANEDLLYAVADGKLMEFSRVREEDNPDDDGERWEFLNVIDTELLEDMLARDLTIFWKDDSDAFWCWG